MNPKDYFTSPTKEGIYPGVILIHEIWGLNDHIRNVADRVSSQGYVVLAPDLLSETGVASKLSPELLSQMSDPKRREGAQQKMREITAPINSPEFAKEAIAKLQSSFQFLKQHKNCSGKIAVVGFCFGGTYSYALATEQSKLSGAIPFYGHAPEDKEKIKNINCPILAFYGEQDTPLMEQLPKLKDLMRKYGKDFKAVVYPNTGHAFFNDTNPKRYNAEAAADSWQKLLAFLQHSLI